MQGSELLQEGLALMGLGMGFVFVFLTCFLPQSPNPIRGPS